LILVDKTNVIVGTQSFLSSFLMLETSNDEYLKGKVLLFNKPYGWTSFQIVKKVRNTLKKALHKDIKVGHAGTLDPLAQGLMIICTGKATRLCEQIQQQEKEYIAEIKLGSSTASYDLETPIQKKAKIDHITKDLILETLLKFEGVQIQTPPIYSAVKIDGARAYKYARKGIEIPINSKEINIYGIGLLEYESPYIKIAVKCSKGTYIRSLARDIGVALDTEAHLTKLYRVAIGEYKLIDAFEIQYFQKNITF